MNVVSKEPQAHAERIVIIRKCVNCLEQLGKAVLVRKLRCVPRGLGIFSLGKSYKRATFPTLFSIFTCFLIQKTTMSSLFALAPVIATPKATADFLMEKNVMYSRSTGQGVFICDECGTQIILCNRARNVYIWQCPSFTCKARKTRSFRSGSFFFNVKIPLNHTLAVLHLWTFKVPLGPLSGLTETNPKTIRELVRNSYYALEESLPDEYVCTFFVLYLH
jgi:hypothetical protein